MTRTRMRACGVNPACCSHSLRRRIQGISGFLAGEKVHQCQRLFQRDIAAQDASGAL